MNEFKTTMSIQRPTMCEKCGLEHLMNQTVVDEKKQRIFMCCINCAYKYKLTPISELLK